MLLTGHLWPAGLAQLALYALQATVTQHVQLHAHHTAHRGPPIASAALHSWHCHHMQQVQGNALVSP